jgi:glutathione peroxidase
MDSSMFNIKLIQSLAVVLGLVALSPSWAQPITPPQAQTVACPTLLNHTFPRLQDEKPQSLCQYSGKVILVVNTASYCGFTSQYKGLEAVYSQYKDKGLVVLGFPSNDFAQEKSNNQDIADFCENTFGVKFPMFTKTNVTGDAAAPFFKQLAQDPGQRPKWNFYKYLIGRDGKLIDSYNSMTGPESNRLVQAIEKGLARKAS